MICKKCTDEAEKTKLVFTRLERVHILAAATSMARHIHHGTGRSTEQDKIINNSVITKMILSLEPEIREPMMRNLREVAGIDINLKSCGHSALSVVT